MGTPQELLGDAAWLRARRADGWSVTRLAARLGVDHKLVSAALRRAELPVPLPPVRHFPRLHDVHWLTVALAEHSVAEVARLVGCTPQSVRYAARRYGVACPVKGHDPPPEAAARLADRGWLRARRAEGATVVGLAKELGVGNARVGAAVRAAGLGPLRRNGSRPAFPELYDAEWVRAQLAVKTRTQVANELSCSLRSVRDAAQRAGVPLTRRSPKANRS